MANYCMTVDERLCVTCKACVGACKQENDVPTGKARCWTCQEEYGVYPNPILETRSERCNHCENAPCVYVCPTQASHYTEDGIVLVDYDKCIGCKACIVACPYDVRFTHHHGYVDKCTFCDHRIHQKGVEPACVTVCPTDALTFGDLDDPKSKVSKQIRERDYELHKPDQKTKPKLFYLK